MKVFTYTEVAEILI